VNCPRCDLVEQGVTPPAGLKHKPTMKMPSIEELERQSFDGVCEATDGCQVEPDGRCPHGHASWMLVIGIV